MYKIALQAGHEGRTSGATGAPGEIELNVRIRNRLSQILQEKGFQLFLFNADPPQSDLNQDFDLFLALHGDANIYGTGGGVIACIAPPPVDSSETSNAESRRIRDAIQSEYFKHSEIVEHPERVNRKMTEYYMWSKLSNATHCVILEMGVVQDAHDKVLLNDTERIASAIARGVCKAYGVSYEVVVPEPTPIDPHFAEIEALKNQLNEAQKNLLIQTNHYEAELAVKDEECKQKLAAYKLQIKADIKKLIDAY